MSDLKKNPWAKCRHKPGEMNKSEAAYAEYLELLKRGGEISNWWFEALTLKLAKDCRLTIDFLVQTKDGFMELHDVKGFWDGDAKVKMRMAADKFPFRLIAVKPIAKKHGGGWAEEEF